MLSDTVNYYGGLGGFGSQIVPAGDGAGLTALSSSSARKPPMRSHGTGLLSGAAPWKGS